MNNARVVIHSHMMDSCVVTIINLLSNGFQITHMEIIKGIQKYGYYDELMVLIIENTAHEEEHMNALAEAN